jgi:cytochrome P450
MWALGRNQDVFGEDVDTFRPERWLESREKCKAYEKADLTFGAGMTTCLGKYELSNQTLANRSEANIILDTLLFTKYTRHWLR